MPTTLQKTIILVGGENIVVMPSFLQTCFSSGEKQLPLTADR
jgi:hypothetical protein